MSSSDKPRKLTSLDQLIPEKTAVETSCGTLYVRAHRTSELSALHELEDESVGRLVLQTLCGHVQAKQDLTGITEQTLHELNPQDFLNLVQAVAEQERWKQCSAIKDFKELGQTFAFQRAQKQKALLERLNSHQGIAHASQFVGAQLQLDEAWKTQLDALNETNRKLQESLSGNVHHGLHDATLIAGAHFQPDEKWKALQDLCMQPPLQALDATSTTVSEMLDSYDPSKLDVAAQLAKGFPQREDPLPYISPARMWDPPSAEDTPLGKATLQSASELQQIKKLAEKSEQGSVESMRIARNSFRVSIAGSIVGIASLMVAVWPPNRSETAAVKDIPPASNQLSPNLPNSTPVETVKASNEATATTKPQSPKQPEGAKSAPAIQN